MNPANSPAQNNNNAAPGVVAPSTAIEVVNNELSLVYARSKTFQQIVEELPAALRVVNPFVYPIPITDEKKPAWKGADGKKWYEEAVRLSDKAAIAALQARCDAEWRYKEWAAGIVASPETTCVIDCDKPGVAEHIKRDTGRDMPRTFTALSANRKLPHYYFLPTDYSRAICDRSKSVGEFDFWVSKHHSVAPGSSNGKGGVYTVADHSPLAPIPDWLVDWILAQHSEFSAASGEANAGALGRLKAAYQRNLDPEDLYSIEGLSIDDGRHPTIHSLACYIHDGKRDEIELTEILTRVWETYCSRGVDESEIERIVQNVMEKDACLPSRAGTLTFGGKTVEPQKAPGAEFKLPRVDGGDFDFVLNPLPSSDDGWFPRGDVSLFAAPSGGGKTTVVLDLLAKQIRGEECFGHVTNKMPYLVLLQDRGMRALRRTLKRLRIDPDRLPYRNIGYGDKVKAVAEAIETTVPMPQVVFIEGIDLLEGDSGKGQNVEALLSRLYRVADHYHVAIIGSTGCPKMKPKDTYTSQRDRVIGSSVWGRKVETIVTLQREHGHETDEITMMTVLPRNAKVEEFRLEFKDGRLVEAPPVAEHVAQELSPEAFVRGRGKFSRAQLQRAMGWSKNKTCDWIGAELGATLRRGGKHPDFFYEAIPWEVPAENVGG
jgi:hypothetical protein